MKTVRESDFSKGAVDGRHSSRQARAIAVIAGDIPDSSARGDLETVILRGIDQDTRSITLGLGVVEPA